MCYGHTPAAGMGGVLFSQLGRLGVQDEVQAGLTPSYIAREHLLQACLSSQRFAGHRAIEPHISCVSSCV